jgi:hypothetical protein
MPSSTRVKSSGTSQITNGKNITKHLMGNRIIDLIGDDH